MSGLFEQWAAMTDDEVRVEEMALVKKAVQLKFHNALQRAQAGIEAEKKVIRNMYASLRKTTHESAINVDALLVARRNIAELELAINYIKSEYTVLFGNEMRDIE